VAQAPGTRPPFTLWSALRALWKPRAFDVSGRRGEKIAARHLRGLGYEILAENYRVRGGEADLIVTKDGLVVAVEVKSRSGRRFGSAAEAVTRVKARRVLLAGRTYCRRQGFSLSRFRGDVVTVEVGEDASPPTVQHWPGGLNEA
jgi:putative endonuclease